MVLEFKKLSGLYRRKRYGDILVGISFMALTFLTIKTFAPDIRSDADTNTASAVSGPYTASISANTLTSINITPTATQTVYTGNAAILYTNSCPYGFNVTMSADSEDTNLTRVGDDDATKTIPSTTTTFLADNTWGYSIDNGSTYNPIPALSNPANIINTFEATTNPATLNLTFGIKTNSDLPSGKYSNDVVYTVSVKPQCLTYGVTWDLDGGTAATGVTYPAAVNFGQTIDLTNLAPTKAGYAFTGWSNGLITFDGTETVANINPSEASSITMTAQWRERVGIHSISNMQDMTPAICEETTTPSASATVFDWDSSHHGDTNYVPRTKLKDTRDNKYYLVSKLADGSCWMSQNLAFEITASTPVIASNIDGTTRTVIPDNTTQTVSDVAWERVGDTWRSYKAQEGESYYQNGITEASAPSGTGEKYDWEKTGVLYNWYAATAGTGTATMTSANTSVSICPKGWRLPSNTGSKSYDYLIKAYGITETDNGLTKLSAAPLNFTAAGYYALSNGARVNQGKQGAYWSSSASSVVDSAYRLRFMNNYVNTQVYNKKGYGISMRCVAINNTMQNYDTSNLNVGDSIVLEDERDGNKYTVKRLDDGRVWMMQNLRIIDKTITSEDSNLPSGETWTIPASDLTTFNDTQNTNSAYIDSNYGGYYSFYAATAGWGTNSETSGYAPKDICPKGWRLPLGAEYQKLYEDNYNSSSAIVNQAGFVYSGYLTEATHKQKGSKGYYWSSTVVSATSANDMSFSSSSVSVPGTGNKTRGRAVRCVVDETMQKYDTSYLKNTGDSILLTDERDGNKYVVRKLADGKVWMTENLRIIDKTITSEDSDLPEGEAFVIPASDINSMSYENYDTPGAYYDPAISEHGGYYNQHTATAGWATRSASKYSISTKSICPKGWRLPTASYPNGDFHVLRESYTGSDYSVNNAAVREDTGFINSGRVTNKYLDNVDVVGYYWSANPATYLDWMNSLSNTEGGLAMYYGFTIRCIAGNTTINNISYMQEIAPWIIANTAENSSTTLRDSRDGKSYVVKKLKDGNVWMAENLRIANKTITSTDSNLPSGETYTIPASNISDFTLTQNTDAAFVDDDHGGYYNFYTATAGWGTDSVTSGNAPKDICPRGWKLPTGKTTGEFAALYRQYNSPSLMQGDPGFALTGGIYNGAYTVVNERGRFMSSSVYDATRAYNLRVENNSVGTDAYNGKYVGVSVRCIAKK